MLRDNLNSSTFLIAVVLCLSCQSQSNKDASIPTWLDPALNMNAASQPVVIWFDDQFLQDGTSFLKKIEEVRGENRSDLRKRVIKELKEKSRTSYQKVSTQLEKLVSKNKIENVKQHWIVNGFTCVTTAEGPC